jgi:hypothetical protein
LTWWTNDKSRTCNFGGYLCNVNFWRLFNVYPNIEYTHQILPTLCHFTMKKNIITSYNFITCTHLEAVCAVMAHFHNSFWASLIELYNSQRLTLTLGIMCTCGLWVDKMIWRSNAKKLFESWRSTTQNLWHICEWLSFC